MSDAERLQLMPDATALRNSPKKPEEQRVTSPLTPGPSILPDETAKLASYTPLHSHHGSSSTLSQAVFSGQVHAASGALLSQDLAPHQLVKSQAHVLLSTDEQGLGEMFIDAPKYELGAESLAAEGTVKHLPLATVENYYHSYRTQMYELGNRFTPAALNNSFILDRSAFVDRQRQE